MPDPKAERAAPTIAVRLFTAHWLGRNARAIAEAVLLILRSGAHPISAAVLRDALRAAHDTTVAVRRLLRAVGSVCGREKDGKNESGVPSLAHVGDK